jgi:DNA-binding response OmpR family regulator
MPNSRDNITVLVADDEPSTLALVASHVRSKGYKVLEASDGDQAWQLAHEHLPDLVVLDVMMPGMSGWEVCRKIREAVSLAHTGVVMLTGIGENLNEMTSPLYGADTYIDKPFEFTELDAKIRETLEQRQQQGAMGRPDTGTSKRASSPPPASDDISPSDRSTPVEDRPTAPSARHVAVEAPAKARAPKKAKAANAPAKKKTAKKAAPKKKVKAKKAAARKAPPKKKTAKKTAKKAPARKKKAAPKKGKAAKKAPAKKAKKAPAKKAPARAAKAKPKKAAPKPKAAKAKKAKRPAPKPAAPIQAKDAASSTTDTDGTTP